MSDVPAKPPPKRKHVYNFEKREPRLDDFPELSERDRKALQKLLVAPLTHKTPFRKNSPITVRRKVYFFFRMLGVNHAQALRKARYRSEVWTEKKMLAGGDMAVMRRFFKLDKLDLGYVLDRLVKIVESGENENAKVRALEGIAKLKGYLVDRQIIDINETMQVQFQFAGPSICPHCRRQIVGAGATATAIPAQVTETEWEVDDRPPQEDQEVPVSDSCTGTGLPSAAQESGEDSPEGRGE